MDLTDCLWCCDNTYGLGDFCCPACERSYGIWNAQQGDDGEG